MNKDEIIKNIQEQKRLREPHAKRKALLLLQLKEVSKQVKKHDNTILYLTDLLQEKRE